MRVVLSGILGRFLPGIGPFIVNGLTSLRCRAAVAARRVRGRRLRQRPAGQGRHRHRAPEVPLHQAGQADRHGRPRRPRLDDEPPQGRRPHRRHRGERGEMGHPAAPAPRPRRAPSGITAAMTPDILCIGSVLWDIIGRSNAHMAKGSDVPGRITRIPGGVALNIAMAARAYGMTPALLSVVGRDAEGDELVAALDAHGPADRYALPFRRSADGRLHGRRGRQRPDRGHRRRPFARGGGRQDPASRSTIWPSPARSSSTAT